ncbi:hypothetical protein GCM10027275_05220 [Rhabdobacter roseus]|uniref:Lipoprotein signal peptidase n=1 Tax=Rhabdobacter roseus TaxID=1655419 RepID=A0A840TMF1_9BACT|nr:lipoprotein signal peptidase [Rhabdobacter roseus]MBB5282413.1 signal peptidase II [Rhabdobacter roseus]
MNPSRNPTKYLLFSLFLIGLDQASKILVHTYMEPGFSGQISLVGDWLKLHYVLNPGMAFGMQLSHEYGKLFLTLFRLVAMGAICWYLINLARRGASSGLLWALAMILAGAVGNVIDSTFYGVWFNIKTEGASTPWFHGQVIDMIFVDFWEGFIPDWVPLWGGQYYSTPIFNIADACIFVGVCIILVFQSHFFTPSHPDDEGYEADDYEDYTNPAVMDTEGTSGVSEDYTPAPPLSPDAEVPTANEQEDPDNTQKGSL